MKMRCSFVSRQYQADIGELFPWLEVDSFDEGREGGGATAPPVATPQPPQNFWPGAIAEPH